MKASQVIEKKKSYENRKEILINKIQEIAESDQLARIDIERHIEEVQSETRGKDSERVICDFVDDPSALDLTASLLYHQIRIDTFNKKIERTNRRLENKKEELSCYLWDRYNLEDGTAYYFDYCKLLIVEGISPAEREAVEELLRVATKLIHSSDEELAVLSGHAEELNGFEKDLLGILVGPEGEELKATYETLLQMNGGELQDFILKEKRKPVHFIAQMLKDLATT